MSGIIGSKFNHRGSGLIGSLGTDGQHFLSSGAGKTNVFETVTAAESLTPVRQDVLTLALRQAVQENSTKFNLPNSSITKFEADADYNSSGSTNTDRNSSEYIEAISLTPITAARYWQSYKTNGAGGGNWHQAMEVFETSGTSEVTPTSGMISQSGLTTHASYPGSVVAGDISGYMFHTDSAGIGSYLRIDFGADNGQVIDKWRYYASAASVATWKIQYSADASSWTDTNTGGTLDMTSASSEWITASWVQGTAAVSATGTALGTTNVPTSSVTEVSGVLLNKDTSGATTFGTDVKVYFTADNSAFTEATSYADAGTFTTGIKMIKLGKTTVTSGSDVRWKIVWANQEASVKVSTIYGVGLNY